MRLSHLIRVALSMPLDVALRKAAGYIVKRLRNRFLALARRGRCPYPPVESSLRRHLTKAVGAVVDDVRLTQWRAHRFDLLGSGPVLVAHGETYPGFGPHRYGPGPVLPGDWRTALVAGQWPGGRDRAAAILALIDDADYRPIDWQVDFKSGYRWSVRTLGGSIPYGHLPGVDVKLPWELARLQHLPVMALAFAAGGDAGLAREFRHQALDFLGSNPPGWGVNWACAMDVAIRAANLLLAWDLFRAAGAAFDARFEAELAAAALAHGRHVMANLEWNEHHRGNHYLADLCGLAFCAAYQADSAETGDWLTFCRREIEAEVLRQFLPDGGNFEASTAYHRLSAEMALYAAALLGGLSEAAMARLSLVAGFARDVTKPSGVIVQIGDNDSGRFIALRPGEAALDLGSLIALSDGLFGLGEPSSPEGRVAAQLAGRRFPLAAPPPIVLPARPIEGGDALRLVLIPPDPAALAGLEAIAYPDFGLFLWKNARSFISVRCGPIGQNGNGGHAHNDQLAVEIEIDGIAWARDPGSFVYTPDLVARNAYRSALAHFVPRRGNDEPARFISPFRLEDRAKAELLRFGPDFVGRHYGFGSPVQRRVAIENGAVVVEDRPGRGEHLIRSPEELVLLWGLDLPFSPGYGLINR